MEKKEEKMKYYCAYCGHPYDSPIERAKCENSCWEKQQKNKAMEKALQLQKINQIEKVKLIMNIRNYWN